MRGGGSGGLCGRRCGATLGVIWVVVAAGES